MDLDSESWDVTCEVEGSNTIHPNTIDSGRDSPSCVLLEGDYELRSYAGEDDTELDGIYVTGQSNQAPTVLMLIVMTMTSEED